MQQNTILNFIHKSPAIILRQSFNILTAYSLCFFVNKGLHIQSECAGCQQQNIKSSRRLASCNYNNTDKTRKNDSYRYIKNTKQMSRKYTHNIQDENARHCS